MIKLERISVFNWENAIRGMRNPMDSHSKSDSYDADKLDRDCGGFILGGNDLRLARRLVKAGSDHRKFMRQIFVSIDITAPLYWWKEYDTYKVGTTANSCSTMHRLHKKEFTINDCSCERLSPRALSTLHMVVDEINYWRNVYNKSNCTDKDAWYQMIQMLPSSYNQMRTCTLSYENLLNMYFARRHHKLDEWHVFCDMIRSLPNFERICLDGRGEDNRDS